MAAISLNTYLILIRSLWHSVIPGRDPESREHTFVNNLVAYTGFRVQARNDKMPPTSYRLKWIPFIFRMIPFSYATDFL